MSERFVAAALLLRSGAGFHVKGRNIPALLLRCAFGTLGSSAISGLFSTLVLLPGLILDFHPMTLRQLVFLLLAGTSAAGGQLAVTAAYQHAPARDISVFDYSQIVYAALFGFFLFGELPDRWSFLGYAIIIGTSFVKWYLVTKRK